MSSRSSEPVKKLEDWRGRLEKRAREDIGWGHLLFVGFLGVVFWALIWALVFHLDSFGTKDRATVAFFTASIGALVAGADVAFADEPSFAALVAAYFGVLAAAVIGPIDGGPLDEEWAQFAALVLTGGGLFGLSFTFIVRTNRVRTSQTAEAGPDTGNDQTQPAEKQRDKK